MSENKKNQKNDNEEDFYEGVAQAANFVNERLDNTILPGVLNNTVKEYAQEDEDMNNDNQIG